MINFSSPWNRWKTFRLLMISGWDRSYIKEWKLLKFYSLYAFEPKFGGDELVLVFSKDNISWNPIVFMFQSINLRQYFVWIVTAQEMKFFIKDFFSKCDQIRKKLWIWSHLLKKPLMGNFSFCAVCQTIHMHFVHLNHFTQCFISIFPLNIIKKTFPMFSGATEVKRLFEINSVIP